MRRFRLFLFLAAVAAVSAIVAPQAFAQAGRPVHIVQTDCDTLSLDPPLVRVEFGVINLGTIPVCSIHLIPIQSGPTPADSCRILECSNAPGWHCALDPANGGATWFADPVVPPGCIGPGEKHEPFDIVLDPLYCCYIVQYDDGAGTVFFTDEVCFECQKPVPTRNTTWGSVKAQYR
jgi:hypothetical protein